MPINLALTKKDIAKIVRRVYDQYVSVICMEDLAAILQDINSNDLDKIFEKCASLTTYNNETLNSSHAEILTKLITEEFNKINHSVLNRNELKIPA